MTQAKIFMVICTLALGSLVAAPDYAAGQWRTRQERWVLQQVAAGQVADLYARFGEKEEDRYLSARFLEDLLTGAFRVHRKGIVLANAIIAEPLNLELAQIPQVAILVACRFKEPVVFRDAIFEKHFMLIRSHFDQRADFQRIKGKMNLFLTSTTFKGSLDLGSAYIGGHLNAQEAMFQGQEEKDKANFNGLKVGQNAFFDKATFQGPVDFGGVDISRQFSASEARFEGREEKSKANFNGLKVGQNAFLDKVTFQGPVNFVAAEIGEVFSARGARFAGRGEKSPANFNCLKVGHAFLDKVTFQGPVNFSSANIAGQFNANGAQFLSKEYTADFNGLKVGQGAFFDNATFHGPVNFIQADIGVVFSAKEIQFLHQEETANFKTMRVGQSAYFNKAVFQGPVNFLQTNILGQFNASGAQFLSKKDPAVFEGMRVGQSALFWEVTCRSDVYLTDGNFFDLYIQGAKEDKKDETAGSTRLNLKGTLIHRESVVQDLKLAALDARHLRVKRKATFQNLVIKESANFQNAVLGPLEFKEVTWPDKKENLELGGMTYTSLAINQPDNYQGLLELVENSAFNSQNYLQLANYFKRSGHDDWADEVFMALKDRELGQMGWYNPGRWLVLIFWGWLAGYGQAPLRILWFSLVIVILGAYLFDPKHLEDDKRPPASNKYRTILLRFLISLDRFLPAVDMRLAKNWKAKDTPFPIWAYFTIERGLGWVLISIALVAIYTQIK